MRLAPALLLLLLPLAACVQPAPPAPTYAFAGTWDCGGTTVRFTATTYDNGTRSFPIRTVAQDRNNFTLFLEGATRIGLALVTETGMTLVTTSGDQQSCRRAN